MRLIVFFLGLILLACNSKPKAVANANLLAENWLEQELLRLQADSSFWELHLEYQGKQDRRKPKADDWQKLLEELNGREVKKALQQAVLDSGLHEVRLEGDCSAHSILCSDKTSKLKNLKWRECAGKLSEIEVQFMQQTAIFSSGKTIRYESGKSYLQTYWECLPGGDTLVTRIEARINAGDGDGFWR